PAPTARLGPDRLFLTTSSTPVGGGGGAGARPPNPHQEIELNRFVSLLGRREGLNQGRVLAGRGPIPRPGGLGMARGATAERSAGRRHAVRVGRPPRELAGEVESRILNAARRAFLERGLDGASVDEIARIARAGKPTIYARFPNKEALFTA